MADTLPPVPDLPGSLAHLGALIGDPVRAALVLHLSDGSRRPAGELAALAGASQQAVSVHLSRLVGGGLLRVEPQGRHRFYALASGEVAEVLESLAAWLDRPRRTVARDAHLQEARLCYDHLAGRLGVAIFDRMTALGFLGVDRAGTALSGAGDAWCERIGLSIKPPPKSRRPLVRLCLDWTERRTHLGGGLGAALARHMMDTGLINPGPHRRALLVTARGAAFLNRELGVAAKGCAATVD